MLRRSPSIITLTEQDVIEIKTIMETREAAELAAKEQRERTIEVTKSEEVPAGGLRDAPDEK